MFEGINIGDVVSAIVVLKSVSEHTTRGGKKYFRLLVNDGQNEITAFVWEPELCPFEEGTIVKLKGKYGKYDEKDKIDVISVEATTEQLKIPTMKTAEQEEFVKRFKMLVGSIQDKDFVHVISSVFDEDTWSIFTKAPAAVSNHQAYLGGLLEHSVVVAERCKSMAEHEQNNLNLDLLITGALLHDIGKIYEYSYLKGIERTTTGKLLGHTSLGLLIISRLMPEDISKKKSTELLHLIVSHHGKREWGAPIEPLMKEAFILHFCDMTDSYSARFDEVKDEHKATSDWSSFDRTYSRSWYLSSIKK
jgi:3'-5' exoribonuclease